MNPEEKVLLERTLKLSEENNVILQKMQKTARWAILWGFIKVAIIVVPLIIGFVYLQPFLEQFEKIYTKVLEILSL